MGAGHRALRLKLRPSLKRLRRLIRQKGRDIDLLGDWRTAAKFDIFEAAVVCRSDISLLSRFVVFCRGQGVEAGPTIALCVKKPHVSSEE